LFYEEKALKSVHKYQLAQRGVPHSLFLPPGSQVLRVEAQFGSQYVWVFVDWTQPTSQQYDFLLVGTGEVVPDGYWPINTLSEGIAVGEELHAFARMPLADGYASHVPQAVAHV
jgi:hypothetical protein